MATSINQIALSGEVRKVFENRTVGEKNLSNASFSVKYLDGKFESQVIVQVFGDQADSLKLEEGDYVLVAGRLKEVRWQNKTTEEWNGRHDLVAHSVVNVSELEGAGALDD